jgi:hypothetical protein
MTYRPLRGRNCRAVPPKALFDCTRLSNKAFPIRLGADNRHIAGKNRNVP